MVIPNSEANEPQQGKQKAPPLKTGPKAKPWHMILAGALVFFYLFWLADKTFGPPAEYQNDKTRANEALTAIVSPQAGPTGDLTKVKPEDREKFLAMLAGAPISPRTVLVNYWKSRHLGAGTRVKNFFGRFHSWFP